MKRPILKYIFLPAISLLLCLTVLAQNKQKKEEKKPLYTGTYINADLFGIGSKLFGSDFLSSEVGVTVSLKNRFLPVVEVGYGTTDATNENGRIHYKSSAPFFRVGMNYNTMFKSSSESFLYAGVRYGFSSFKYDVDATIYDPIWKDEYPFSYNDQKSTFNWAEILLGINVQIYKNFHMGCAVRYKLRISVKENEFTDPWYVPGYGSNKSSNFGVTYSLIYKLPFK